MNSEQIENIRLDGRLLITDMEFHDLCDLAQRGLASGGPVAWMVTWEDGRTTLTDIDPFKYRWEVNPLKTVPLYAAPPAAPDSAEPEFTGSINSRYIALYREICGGTPLLNNQECEVLRRLVHESPGGKVADSVAVPIEVVRFLKGSAPLDGVWFGDPHPDGPGQYWWRKYLPDGRTK